MSTPQTLFVVLPITVLIAAIVALGGSTIDGFRPGVMVKCSPPFDVDVSVIDASCGGDPKRAIAALDARDPGHAAIVSMEAYTDATQPGPIDFTGPGIPPTAAPRHPGPNVTVFVFKLADGSTRATGVACTKDATNHTSCV